MSNLEASGDSDLVQIQDSRIANRHIAYYDWRSISAGTESNYESSPFAGNILLYNPGAWSA